ncbi:MAG: substrate-binding domain-containing protein [Pseudomonadota bacterium]
MKKFIINLIIILICSVASARDEIRIVGSSTLYPFITIEAEKFGKEYGKTPVVEATGTGGGMHLFCSGNSLKYPDIVNASRSMKKSEMEFCLANKVTNIKEIMLGYDGIVIAVAKKALGFTLSKEELFLALARKIPQNGEFIDNYYKTWNQINPNLPRTKIEIYGPSFTSGTRDALIELVMSPFCGETSCKEIRDDGAFIEMPENDNLIIHKLLYNKNAIGIISFSLLNENNKIKAIMIDNIYPTKNTIVDGNYPLARPLYIYVNMDHIKELPRLIDFINELVSEKSLGPNGYLTQKGLLTKE